MLSLLSILGLALVDSMSVGTLVVPLMLVVNQRTVQVRPLAIYFWTVCASYFLIGVAILLGINGLQRMSGHRLDRDPVYWAQLVIGAALLVFGVFSSDPKKRNESDVRQPRNLSAVAMVSLGLSVVVVEVATMVPYLGAISILSSSDMGLTSRLGVLGLYCLVMVVPAVIGIGLLAAAGEWIWPRVERFVRWAEREARVTLLWLAAIVGLYLIRNAAQNLGFLA